MPQLAPTNAPTSIGLQQIASFSERYRQAAPNSTTELSAVGTALFDGPPTHSEYPFNAVKGAYSSGNEVMSAWFSQSRTLGGEQLKVARRLASLLAAACHGFWALWPAQLLRQIA